MACRIVHGMIICGSFPKIAPCGFCKRSHSRLCDFPLETDLFGTVLKTCDAFLCDEDAYHCMDGSDLCPDHWPMGGKIIGDIESEPPPIVTNELCRTGE